MDRRGNVLRHLLQEAERWRDADPDPATRAEAAAVIERRNVDELTGLFGGRLEFGTAGLRGPLGPGPNRMNRLVCRQTAAALARVLPHEVPHAAERGVVVAHDARTGSEQFAADIADVLAGHGIGVQVIVGPAPTPLAAFAVLHLGAAGAVVVTASHNPPQDNGIKVYWADGAQIVPPVDGRIAAAIAHVARDGVILPPGSPTGRVTQLGPAAAETPLVRAYLRAAERLVPGPPARPVPLAVTSLHGVGAGLLRLTLEHLDHGPVHDVASQREPDPRFPTVAFPNPEEPGAMDELLSLARSTGSALAMANDPDADRLALAAPGPDGTWQLLTGDETGALLADHLLRLTEGVPDRLVATTVVSSRLLGAMAHHAGVHFAETLTGFKWLCRPGLAHSHWHQVFLYEEALGYAIGPATRDKDGITAALVAADAACALAAAGRTVWDVLDDLARAHGAHVTDNGSVRIEGPHGRRLPHSVAASLADSPRGRLGGLDVARTEEPAAHVLRMWLTDDTRVVLRPSGTEPKFKYYCEAIEPVSASEPVGSARRRARLRLGAVVDDVSELVGGSGGAT